MSTPVDYAMLEQLLEMGLVKGSALEVGSKLWPGSSNAADLCRRHGVEWTGTDIEAGPGVDVVLDILDADAVAAIDQRWDSVLVMNLLEHVYDPISALRNCGSLVAEGGTCVIIGPISWQLHDYPHDYWRPMPDFFLEFADREGWKADTSHMWYLTLDRLVPLDQLTASGQKNLPSAAHATSLFGRTRTLWSQVVHRGFNTYGRDVMYLRSGLGVVLRKIG